MKISYSWIKELVDVKIAPEKLADAMSMAGLSVEHFEEVDGDWVYTIEVTSNRPDWLSARGIVHEIAAMTGQKLKKSQVTLPAGRQASHKSQDKAKNNTKRNTHDAPSISVKIEDQKGCAFYYGQAIRNVRVGPSPAWLAKRLETLGIRCVNNVVDITNYCLLELGQPLHAFDLDKLSGPAIVVRRAKKGERIDLIDGSAKELDERILVIADNARAVAVAGIMGGAGTEVTAGTKNIFLESACFDPVVVRRGSRCLGVSSDSSYRFERGVDPETVRTALSRAAQMVVELCGGVLTAPVRAGRKAVLKPRKIAFDLAQALDTLGVDIPTGKARKIFQALGMGVAARGRARFIVTTPSFRRDLKAQEDLTEELIRVWGYDRIPLTSASIRPFAMAEPDAARILEKRTREFLVGAGLKEIVTYSLISEEDLQKTGLPALADNAPALENPLNRDHAILRSTLVPSLLKCASTNVNRNNKDLELFETAAVFSGQEGREEISCGILLCGDRRASWLKDARPYTFFDIKGLVEALAEEFGLRDLRFEKAHGLPFADAGQAVTVFLGHGSLAKAAGLLCRVSPEVKKAHGIKAKDDVFIAELSLEALGRSANLKKCLAPLVVFPGIVRDVSFLADEKAPYEKVRAIVDENSAGLVRRVRVVDVYQGKGLPPGSSSITISVEYGSKDKTLTDEEANAAHRRVLAALIERLGVKIR